VTETPSDNPTARISGSTRAWTQAFSPGGNISSLAIDGDRQMAEYMIGQLARTESQAAEGIDRAVA
jgi:hypothetical protein